MAVKGKASAFIVAVRWPGSDERDDIRFFGDRDEAMRYALSFAERTTRGVHITRVSAELFDLLRDEVDA